MQEINDILSTKGLEYLLDIYKKCLSIRENKRIKQGKTYECF